MTDFSIEIITRGEKSLNDSLDSIAKQSYNSFEIVCANSSSDPSVAKILNNHSVRHLEVGPVRHLRGRELAHSLSSGKFCLIMDSTRLLEPNALEVLNIYIEQYDMVAIREGSIGEGFWVNQARVYKNISEKNIDSNVIREKIPSYILPRLYRNDILTNIFFSLKQKIPDKLFNSIGYGEHHIIFQEALSMTQSFYYYRDNALIKHYEDPSLGSIYRKYRNYGMDQIILRDLPDYHASHLSSHSRKLNRSQIMGNIICLPLISVRTISFLVGILL